MTIAAPPVSSEQVLHPEKYWDPEQRDDPIPVRLDTSQLPAGWTNLYENTLGEVGLAMVVEPLKKRKMPKGQLGLIGLSYTTKATEGWGGDRYVLLGKGKARVLLSTSIWDTEKDRQEFTGAYKKLWDHMTAAAGSFAEFTNLDDSGFTLTNERLDGGAGFLHACSWVGAEEDEVAALLATVSVSISAEVPAPAPATGETAGDASGK